MVNRVYTNDDRTDYFDLSLENNDVVAMKQGNVYMHCKYVIGPNGEPILKDGETTVKNDDGSVRAKQIIKDYKLISTQGNLYNILSDEDRAKIKQDYNLSDEELRGTLVRYEQDQNGKENISVGAINDPLRPLSDALKQFINPFLVIADPNTQIIEPLDPVELARRIEARDRLNHAVLGLGYKSQTELAMDKQDTISAILLNGKKGDVLITSGDDITGFGIRAVSGPLVNHAGFLDVDSDGSKWVVDINPRGIGSTNDLKRVRFEDWAKNYAIIIAGRATFIASDGRPAGEAALDTLMKQYMYDQTTNVFKRPVIYNWAGLIGWGNNKPNMKICSELVHDAFKFVNGGKSMPGVITDPWRVSPGNLLSSMQFWGRNIRDISG